MNRTTTFALLSLSLLAPQIGFSADVPESPYLKYVYQYADAMLAEGRDTFGPQPSGLFLSALDRTTMRPLTVRPAPPGGIRREDRVGPPWEALVGANPHRDENFLRVLHVLSGLSGKPAYAEAADAELKWFLEHAASPQTHLLAWGEHMYWNTQLDEPHPKQPDAVHEFARPWVLWDRCHELAPDACEKFARGLWEHQIANQTSGAFDRHAGFWSHGPADNMDYPRHAGFYIAPVLRPDITKRSPAPIRWPWRSSKFIWHRCTSRRSPRRIIRSIAERAAFETIGARSPGMFQDDCPVNGHPLCAPQATRASQWMAVPEGRTPEGRTH